MKNTTETSALSLLANDVGYDPLEGPAAGEHQIHDRGRF